MFVCLFVCLVHGLRKLRWYRVTKPSAFVAGPWSGGFRPNRLVPHRGSSSARDFVHRSFQLRPCCSGPMSLDIPSGGCWQPQLNHKQAGLFFWARPTARPCAVCHLGRTNFWAGPRPKVWAEPQRAQARRLGRPAARVFLLSQLWVALLPGYSFALFCFVLVGL